MLVNISAIHIFLLKVRIFILQGSNQGSGQGLYGIRTQEVTHRGERRVELLGGMGGTRILPSVL